MGTWVNMVSCVVEVSDDAERRVGTVTDKDVQVMGVEFSLDGEIEMCISLRKNKTFCQCLSNYTQRNCSMRLSFCVNAEIRLRIKV